MHWQKCVRCGVHYQPVKIQTAGLCPECWKFLPHYRLTKGAIKTKAKIKEEGWPIEYIILYFASCSLCLLIIGYYLWVK